MDALAIIGGVDADFAGFASYGNLRSVGVEDNSIYRAGLLLEGADEALVFLVNGSRLRAIDLVQPRNPIVATHQDLHRVGSQCESSVWRGMGVDVVDERAVLRHEQLYRAVAPRRQ